MNSDSKNNLVFIHIGKCGGSTVGSELRKNNVKFKEKHITKVKYNPSKEYIIVIRNPISRYVSAFNWRYKLVLESEVQKDRFSGEKELLEKYKNANELAEKIYNLDGNLIIDFQNRKNYIHHLKEDINYYLGDFLSEVNPDKIKGVIATETLNTDLQKLFGIKVTTHKKNNKKETYLSGMAYRNLRKCFAKDYECIDKLYEMKVISKIKYEILSK